jgi:hypothetical protein
MAKEKNAIDAQNESTEVDYSLSRTYYEYEIKSTPVMIELPTGGNKCIGFKGKRAKEPIEGRTSIKIDMNHAQTLNRSWHTKGRILLEPNDTQIDFKTDGID